VTQANIGDLVSGQEYVLIYSATLAGGFPGFFLEQPAVGGGSTGLGGTPGGRLTLQSATPVMPSNASPTSIIYYAPYVNQFVPIWNGSTLQQYNFCSSLSDQVGLSIDMGSSATWPNASSFDIYVTLNTGTPVLAGVQWTNPTTRATLLSIFGGMLTNATTATMRLTTTTTISVPANQATFLGTVYTGNGNGTTSFIYGSAASGGGAAFFGICNYYNKVLFNTIVEDNGAPYTYTSSTVRQARASAGNQIAYIQSDSERAANFYYEADSQLVNAGGALLSTGVGTTTSNVINFSTYEVPNSLSRHSTVSQISGAGLITISANESSDNSNANTFCRASNNLLGASIWL
jgi:hypothetical protein